MIDPVHVLVLSGDDWTATPGEFRNESDFLKLGCQRCWRRWAGRATIRFPLMFKRRRNGRRPIFSHMRSSCWPTWSDLTMPRRALEQFVYDGGGLLVAPGNLSRVDNYNDQLWRDGGGILPAELLDATSAEGDDATNIVGFDAATPVFQFLHQRPDLMLYPTIGRYYPTSPRSSEAHALAWYTSGSPFVVESESGHGRVLLMTTSLDADWSTLPLSSFYLPFVRSAVRYLAAGGLPNHNLRVNEPIHITADGLVLARRLLRPDGMLDNVLAASGGAAAG